MKFNALVHIALKKNRKKENVFLGKAFPKLFDLYYLKMFCYSLIRDILRSK